MVDIRQSLEYGKYLSRVGWKTERIRGVNYFIKKLPLIGSLIKIQRPKKINNKTIIQLSRKYRAFQIIVEPSSTRQLGSLTANGFRQSNSPYLPTKTLHMDLAKSEKDLLAGVKKDARAALRQTRNLRTEEMKNEKQIEEFRNVWKKTVGWKRYVPPVDHLVSLKESFGNNCLFLRSATLRQNAGWPRQSGASTGAIFLATDGIGYYWQAFTGKEGRKEQIQYKIVWEGILWAKKKGTKVFDFEGIYDARFPNEGWLGFTHFKKSFGGYEVSYPGAFVKNVWPFDL